MLAALKAMTGHLVKSKLVSDCKEPLRELGSTYNIRIFWVPRHCEVEGNKDAERLKRLGLSNLYIIRTISITTDRPLFRDNKALREI